MLKVEHVINISFVSVDISQYNKIPFPYFTDKQNTIITIKKKQLAHARLRYKTFIKNISLSHE